MNITEMMQSVDEYLPPDTLKSKLESALKCFPEDVTSLIPSIQLGQDGLTLSNLLLASDNYLCELHLNEGQNVCSFDFIAKNSIFNYRIKTWTHEIREDNVVKASFELAEVELKHGGGSPFVTMFYFAGSAEARASWLDNLTKTIPIALVLKYGTELA